MTDNEYIATRVGSFETEPRLKVEDNESREPMKKLLLRRIRDNGVITMGRLTVAGAGYDCVTLEPSWILNEPYVSCIPIGTYPVVKRTSQKYGEHFWIKDVPQRTLVLMHTLNYFKQTEGCIGVGQRFQYLDSDDHLDVISSQDTLDRLLEMMPDESEIEIVEHENFQRFYNV